MILLAQGFDLVLEIDVSVALTSFVYCQLRDIHLFNSEGPLGFLRKTIQSD